MGKDKVNSVKIDVREECRPLPFAFRRLRLPRPKPPKPPKKESYPPHTARDQSSKSYSGLSFCVRRYCLSDNTTLTVTTKATLSKPSQVTLGSLHRLRGMVNRASDLAGAALGCT